MSIEDKIPHLGMFGPGVGVLHLASSIHQKFPQLSITCFSDRLNSPYSIKEPAKICSLVNCAIEILSSKGVSQILAGCNTSSLFLGKVIQERDEQNIVTPDTLNLLELTISQLQKLSTGSTALLLGSPLLSKAGYYTEQLTELSVIEEGLSGVALDVDQNLHAKRESDYRATLRNIYKQHPKIDAIVIVCTHFEVIQDIIAEEASSFYGRQIPLYLQSDLILNCLKDFLVPARDIELTREPPAQFSVLTNDISQKYISYIEQICPEALVSQSKYANITASLYQSPAKTHRKPAKSFVSVK